MSDDPQFIVRDPAALTPEGRALLAEQERFRQIRRFAPAMARIERQMRRVLETRERAETYAGTGLHPHPARVRESAVRAHEDAKQALLRIIVQEGASEDAALDALAGLLRGNETKSDKQRIRSLLGALRREMAKGGDDEPAGAV